MPHSGHYHPSKFASQVPLPLPKEASCQAHTRVHLGTLYPVNLVLEPHCISCPLLCLLGKEGAGSHRKGPSRHLIHWRGGWGEKESSRSGSCSQKHAWDIGGLWFEEHQDVTRSRSWVTCNASWSSMRVNVWFRHAFLAWRFALSQWEMFVECLPSDPEEEVGPVLFFLPLPSLSISFPSPSSHLFLTALSFSYF